jgi:hypothetical protein
MPDGELFKLADEGTLHDPKILRQQVARMIASEKSQALSRHFAGQWLGFDDLIDSNYTFLNAELARHYGIAGVSGSSMQLVTLTDPNRGGVAGMGSVLTATSLPLRTSSVKRGKWILETMLGEPPPPPLPDAGELPADDKSTAA